MHTVAVLLLTVFFSTGDFGVKAIPAPSMDECRRGIPVAAEALAKTLNDRFIELKAEARVTYVEGYCHRATEATRA